MYPMDFEEFCIANSVQPEIFDYLKGCYDKQIEVRQVVHETMLNLFGLYLIVGGMPDVVRTFVERRVVALQRDIVSQYRQDIIKYAQKATNKIMLRFLMKFLRSLMIRIDVFNWRLLIKMHVCASTKMLLFGCRMQESLYLALI